MDSQLRNAFPNLAPANYIKTSEADRRYNCIAWAAGRGPDEEEWWEPFPEDGYFWPPSARQENTVRCFLEAFRTLRYEFCDNGQRQAGWEKVVLYVDHNDVPTHMARQLPDGKWTSKLGQWIDITHDTVEALEGHCYGKAAYYLRRRNADF